MAFMAQQMIFFHLNEIEKKFDTHQALNNVIVIGC